MTKFESLWANKWLTEGAASIEDLISGLQAAVEQLRQMKAAGVRFQDGEVVDNGMIQLVTTDPKVAEEFGFEEELEEEEE